MSLTNHEIFPVLKHQRGFTLIEILVAVLVLTIGLLGLAGLQATTMRFNHSAYMRSQATNLAYDIADRMRVNVVAARTNAYNIAINANPTGTTLAAQDLQEWRTALATTLPSGTGGIAHLGNIFTITVQWDDSRDSSNPQQFVMTTDL